MWRVSLWHCGIMASWHSIIAMILVSSWQESLVCACILGAVSQFNSLISYDDGE